MADTDEQRATDVHLAHPPTWSVALGLGAGLLMATQSRINAALATASHDGFLAAAASFGTGFVIALTLVLVRRGSRHALLTVLPHQVRTGGLRWWHLGSGLLGAVVVLGQGLAVPLLGVAVFTVVTVAGGVSSSVAADYAGLGPGGRRPITVRRIVAAAGAVAAVALAMAGRSTPTDATIAALALAAIGGLGTGISPALSGQVARRTQVPLVGVVVAFAVGFVALATALLISHLGGLPWAAPPAPWSRPGVWMGGAAGVTAFLAVTIAVRPLGVLLLALLTTAGQLAGSLALDVAFPTARDAITWQLVAGAGALCVMVVVATRPPMPSAP